MKPVSPLSAALVAVLAAQVACSHSAKPTETPQEVVQPQPQPSAATAETRQPAQSAVFLPDQAAWRELYETADKLDFTQSDVKLTMSTGGTSVYAVINKGGRAIGAIIPPNAATKIAGEIMAFHLARALGVADLYQPGVHHFLTGANLAAFQNMIPKAPLKGKWKEANRVSVLKLIKSSPGGIDTVFKPFGTKPEDYDALVNVNANKFNPSHVLKGSKTPFGEFLKCNGKMPSAAVQVSVNKGTSTELDMARQLSSIFLIDALTQQWDRFSGGNLQTGTKDGVVKFMGIDNGGTWGGTNWTLKLLAINSRFDRNVSDGVLGLDEFFTKGRPFMGLQTEADFLQAMGIERMPNVLPSFKKSLKLVANHIRQNQGCYFQ